MFLHEEQMAIMRLRLSPLISPLRLVSWKTKRASITAFGETYRLVLGKSSRFTEGV
jgi:hypothetical protein